MAADRALSRTGVPTRSAGETESSLHEGARTSQSDQETAGMCIGSGKMPGGEMGVKEWAVACRAAWVVWASRSLQGGVGGVWVHGASRGACPPMLLDAVASVGLLLQSASPIGNKSQSGRPHFGVPSVYQRGTLA